MEIEIGLFKFFACLIALIIPAVLVWKISFLHRLLVMFVNHLKSASFQEILGHLFFIPVLLLLYLAHVNYCAEDLFVDINVIVRKHGILRVEKYKVYNNYKGTPVSKGGIYYYNTLDDAIVYFPIVYHRVSFFGHEADNPQFIRLTKNELFTLPKTPTYCFTSSPEKRYTKSQYAYNLEKGEVEEIRNETDTIYVLDFLDKVYENHRIKLKE